jgi:hypothetical protein
MRLAFALVLCAVPAAWTQTAKPAAFTGQHPASAGVAAARAARIPAPAITALEQAFNNRLLSLGEINEPLDLLRDTMGTQLEDYGVVFTAEVSLVRTPGITPFRQKISPELAAHIHQQRVQRMPAFKLAMVEMVRNMAERLTQVPQKQQLVLVVKLYYGSWEDTTGMPSQVTIKTDRASALAGKIETEER